MIAKRCFLLLFSAMLYSFGAFAQPEMKDSAFYKQSIYNLHVFYNKEVGANLSLYNGTEYLRVGSGSKGFPFFGSDDFQKGAITYDGKLYSDVPIQYDLVQDAVIIKDYIQGLPIKLIADKISDFSIFNHSFISFYANKNNTVNMPVGIYDQLYTGKITVLAKREKKVKASSNAEDKASTYVQYNTYYMVRDSVYHTISSEKSVLDLLADKKDQLKKYIKLNKIDFRKNQEEAIIKTVEYYTQLKS